MNTEMTTRETELTARIAELELEVTRLRSVMADVIKAHGYTGGTPVEVMSTPFTPTTLLELIEKVEKMTIERCVEVCDGFANSHNDQQMIAAMNCAAAIREMAQMCSMEALHVADEALSTPFTPTALLELIEKVEKMTIERHCAELERLDYWYSSRATHTLPTDQIKLEELL